MSLLKRSTLLAAKLFAAAIAPLVVHPAAAIPSAEPLKDGAAASHARRVLHRILMTEHGFNRVHAAEVLIGYGESASMRKLFESELAADEATPYRVGVWRALAAAAPTPQARAVWIGKIERVFLDPAAPDQLTATEALCKLREPLAGAALQTARERADSGADGVFSSWGLAVAGESEGWRRLTKTLASPGDRTRLFTAFALSWLRPSDPAVLTALARSADREPPGTAAYPYLLSTALGLQADPAREDVWQPDFDRVLPTLSAEALYDAFHALLPRRTPADIPRVAPLLQAPESDKRVAAAWTILDIVGRAPSPNRSDGQTF